MNFRGYLTYKWFLKLKSQTFWLNTKFWQIIQFFKNFLFTFCSCMNTFLAATFDFLELNGVISFSSWVQSIWWGRTCFGRSKINHNYEKADTFSFCHDVFFNDVALFEKLELWYVTLLSKLTSAEFQSCLIFSLLLLFKYKVTLQK